MPLSKDIVDGANLIRSYQPGEVVVNSQSYKTSLLISDTGIDTDWPVSEAATMTRSDCLPILRQNPELIVIGTSAQDDRLTMELSSWIMHQGFGIEVMPNDAACRTYNLLRSDLRRVVLGIIIS